MFDEIVRTIVEETVKVTLKELGALDHSKRKAPDVMSPKQLAEYLGVSVSWVYQNTKELPHEKRGNKTIFIKSEVDAWREGQRSGQKELKQKIVHVERSKRGLYKVI